MFAVNRAPTYVAETQAAAARLQEQTTPEQYARLVERAERLVDGLFTVETNVDPELQVKIALRERFESPRVKQAILNVATWQLIRDLAESWSARSTAPIRRPVAVPA
jgi:transcription termination factor NusB